MKKILFIVIATSIVLFSGCGVSLESYQKTENVEVTGFPISIKNYNAQGDMVVTTYKKPPQRIVALWQNSIETLIELGAEKQIVAVSGIGKESDLREKNQEIYRKLSIVTKGNMNQEAVLALNPDFILGWLFDFTGKANSIGTWDFWHQRKVPIYMTRMNMADFAEKHVIEDELNYISDIGKIVGHEEKAKHIIEDIQGLLKQYVDYGKGQDKHEKVLILSSIEKEFHVYTPRTLPGDIVTRLGGIVMGKEVEKVGNIEVMSIENVMIENPDVIFIQSGLLGNRKEVVQLVLRHPALQNIKAVKNKRVYAVPFYTVRCPAVRISDSIEIFGKGLYPEFNNV